MRERTAQTKDARFAVCAVALMCCVPHTALGDQLQLLDGTWVIDALKTAENIKKIGPPSHNAEWLSSIVLRQCVTTMTFEGSSMILDPISPAPMAQSFQLEPQSGKQWTYTVAMADGGKDTLTVSFLNTENITAKSAKVGLDEYGVWKRGKRPNRQTAEQDFKQAFDTCASALDSVPFIKAKGR